MIPALRDFENLLVAFAPDPIDDSMFLVDPPRPPTAELSAQWFGFARATKRMTTAFLNQDVKFGENLGIIVNPMTIVLPSGRPKCHPHG
jgi:hypothetical protein